MDYITTALIIIIVSFLIRYLHAAAKNSPGTDQNGLLVLKFHPFIAIIGYAVCGFGILIAIITYFHLIESTGDEVVPYLTAFFLILGLPLILIEKCIRVTVTGEKVIYKSITNKITEIRWDEVRRVTFSFTSQIVLESGTSKVKLNTELTGLDEFVEIMKQKLDPALYEKALQDKDKALRRIDHGK